MVGLPLSPFSLLAAGNGMKPLSGADNAGAPSHGLAEVMARQRTDMAAQCTELAYQRNRFAADRTLMAIMRTSLAMIALGFTIFSVFNAVATRAAIGSIAPERAPGRFGLALVVLGVMLLVAGIDPMERSLIVVSAIVLVLIGLDAVGGRLTRV